MAGMNTPLRCQHSISNGIGVGETGSSISLFRAFKSGFGRVAWHRLCFFGTDKKSNGEGSIHSKEATLHRNKENILECSLMSSSTPTEYKWRCFDTRCCSHSVSVFCAVPIRLFKSHNLFDTSLYTVSQAAATSSNPS